MSTPATSTTTRNGTACAGPPDASLGYLLGRLALLELRARTALAARGGGDGDGTVEDVPAGRFLSDDYVPWLLGTPPTPDGEDEARRALAARLETDADTAEQRGVDIRLRRLARTCGLSGFEQELLVVALAPTVDPRLGRLLARLDDVLTDGSVTVAVAVELARGAHGPADPRAGLALTTGAALVDHRLLEVTEPASPLPVRSVRVPERVVAFLLGEDRPDALLAAYLRTIRSGGTAPAHPVLAALGEPQDVHVVGGRAADPATEAAAWLACHGQRPLVVELPGAGEQDLVPDVVADVLRESLLTGAVPVVGPVDEAVGTRPGRTALERLVDRLPVVVVWSLAQTAPWAGGGVPVLPLTVPGVGHRREVWRSLRRHLDVDPGALDDVATRHHVGAAGARCAVDLATALAGPGRRPGADELRAALRAQGRDAMQGHAHRREPRRSWSDLVLPPGAERRLRELVALVRHRDEVAEDWALGRGGGSHGVCALFAGRSGTGKTLAAEVVAHELGVDLYTVDLARVVDKYVGETEKNLDAVLSAAEGVDGVLLVDEADALFGRRGEIRGGQDRYANLEVSYLLQRIEASGAVVVLATNLRSQVDEAFLRRLDVVVELTEPGPEARAAIWRRHLASVDVDPAADVEFCAEAFDLAGGSIRNAVVAAACLAAEAGRPVVTADLVRGLEREYEKLGRLRVRSDFGRYAELLEVRP